MRICTNCLKEKDKTEFYINKLGYVFSKCKDCYKEYSVKYNKDGHGSWRAMKARCLNETSADYPKYGAKGKFICIGLQKSYEYFIQIVGPRPTPKHSLDRTNNNGNYTCGSCMECIDKGWPLNVRWATHQEQMLNRDPWTIRYKRNSLL